MSVKKLEKVLLLSAFYLEHNSQIRVMRSYCIV